MDETPHNDEPSAEAFEAEHSEEDQAVIDGLNSRHRSRVLVPLGIVILVAIFLGWLGPVGQADVGETQPGVDATRP